ncbi:MAG: ATP synthase F1 subunit gamma [Lachnospiraceae bacterium]|nr:ATP synthase F1 subunit gamma [Lachnospiraceae bacterium]
MASMRDIKRRKESIQSTGQITKAMKLVSTVKLQKAKGRAENTKAYFNHMYAAVNSILAKAEGISHPYLEEGKSPKKAVIVVTSNRGLAGGYNSNVVKLLTKGDFKKEDVVVYAVGRKGRETLERMGYEIKEDFSEVMNGPLFADAVDIGKTVLEAFAREEVGEIYLAYTVFKNTVTHIPTLLRLLPVDKDAVPQEEEDSGSHAVMNFEPEEEEALPVIILKYINSLVFGALIEAVAAENGARMQAMDNATNNAEEMISSLSLMYNRARQSSITQELTEIVAGASAID